MTRADDGKVTQIDDYLQMTPLAPEMLRGMDEVGVSQ